MEMLVAQLANLADASVDRALELPQSAV